MFSNFSGVKKMHTKINLTKIIVAGSAATVAATNSAEAQGFEGAYGGIGIATHSGILGDGYNYAAGPTPVGQAFAGYNFESSGMVFGGEIAIHSSTVYDGGSGDYGISSAVDVKGRVGTAVGNTLIYGSLGVTFGTYEFDGTYDGGPFNAFNFGGGFETNLANNMFIGGDITTRVITNDGGSGKIGYYGPITTAAIRVGMRF